MADGAALVAGRAWADRRHVRWWWLLGMLVYPSMMLAVWPSIEGSEEFADLAADYPDVMKALFGGEQAFDTITTPAGFADTYVFSFMLPLLLLALASAAGAGLLAGEDEDGRLQLLLAQPVLRTSVVLGKAGVVLAEIAMMVALVVALIAAGSPLVDLDIAIVDLVAAGLGSVLYGAFHGALALLAGAASGRRGTALGVAIGAGVAGYLVSSFSELASWLEPFRYLSAMYHATAGSPVLNGIPVADYLALLSATAVALGAAVVVFRHHDLT